ncbi:hypothetical protein C8J57DRAFT_1224802 [Mycena rebaudengoi]|nr:hypothetical protein C8J57DRAFT_1224802 [Mycena rebaudengoi]
MMNEVQRKGQTALSVRRSVLCRMHIYGRLLTQHQGIQRYGSWCGKRLWAFAAIFTMHAQQIERERPTSYQPSREANFGEHRRSPQPRRQTAVMRRKWGEGRLEGVLGSRRRRRLRTAATTRNVMEWEFRESPKLEKRRRRLRTAATTRNVMEWDSRESPKLEEHRRSCCCRRRTAVKRRKARQGTLRGSPRVQDCCLVGEGGETCWSSWGYGPNNIGADGVPGNEPPQGDRGLSNGHEEGLLGMRATFVQSNAEAQDDQRAPRFGGIGELSPSQRYVLMGDPGRSEAAPNLHANASSLRDIPEASQYTAIMPVLNLSSEAAAALLSELSQMRTLNPAGAFRDLPPELSKLQTQLQNDTQYKDPASTARSGPCRVPLRPEGEQSCASARSPSPPPLLGPELLSFMPRSLAHLTLPCETPSGATPQSASETVPSLSISSGSILGKRAATCTPYDAGPSGPALKKPALQKDRSRITIRIPPASASALTVDRAAVPATPLNKVTKGKGKVPDRRNATSIRISTDQDIGYAHDCPPPDLDEDGESEVDGPETTLGYRTDGHGRKIVKAAGIWLTQLLAVFSDEYGPQLLTLISHLQKPEQASPIPRSGTADMKALLKDIDQLEQNAQVAELFYMCKLIQFALNIDQIRREWARTHPRKLGLEPIAKQFGRSHTSFVNWFTWGSRLLHLAHAGTFYILPIMACLGLGRSFSRGTSEVVAIINSLADALREISDDKWACLVRRLLDAIRYVRYAPMPELTKYQFFRGEDTFTFGDIENADRVLDMVEVQLLKLPPRAPDWSWTGLPADGLWSPAEVVVIQTPLKLERTSTLPFKPEDAKTWTESKRELAEAALVVTSVDDLQDKLNQQPGKYLEVDTDIMHLNGTLQLLTSFRKTLVIDDASGLQVVTLMSMPEDMIQRLHEAMKRFDAIMPREYSWESSKRDGVVQ